LGIVATKTENAMTEKVAKKARQIGTALMQEPGALCHEKAFLKFATRLFHTPR
jgi:hypothetical protein